MRARTEKVKLNIEGSLLKILKLSVILVVIIIWIWFSLVCLFKQKNEIAEKNITELISSLDLYLLENGKYPENITTLPDYKRIIEDKLFSIFTLPEITYELESDNKDYKLYFCEAPLGPFYGFDSKSKEWYVEE